MNKITLLLFMLLAVSLQAQNYWQEINDLSITSDAQITAKDAYYYHLNIDDLSTNMWPAPNKEDGLLSPVLIDIPMPNGTIEPFMVFNSPVMEDELMLKYPQFKTFIIQSVKDELTYGRVDITHKGFRALIFSAEGTVYIDPLHRTNNENYIIYYKKNFTTNKQKPTCMVNEHEEESTHIEDNALENENTHYNEFKQLKTTNGTYLRTYRIAVSATGEYTQFHGGTVADGLAAIITSINRINAVYERDFSIHLNLVANNDAVVYTNANTDPFTNPSNASQNLQDNTSSLDNIIGINNYDIGHVVGREGSGLAGLGVVCNNSFWNHKAKGTTGINSPIGDPFDIDYLAHEIGHQFSGKHTFNSIDGSCNGNGSSDSAYEPGSGTTIMAYAGICSGDNTQNNSDDYFHARSLYQIIYFSTQGSGDNCAVKTATNNTIPSVDILTANNLTIPKSTPFELEALATDADGDVVTYCWEQYDLGPFGSPNNPSGNAPLFRSFSPTTNPVRTFPQLDDILNNTQTLGEILPSYQRDMDFRVTARDNKVNHGAVNDENMTISVAPNSGPFYITSQNSNGEVWTSGDVYNITWDVANTTAAPVSCNYVDIYLSTDGGQNFTILLDSNVVNNGFHIITAPEIMTTQARIKVKASNNVFFDINNKNFTIQLDCATVDASISFPNDLKNAVWCENSTGVLDFDAYSAIGISSYQWYKDGALLPGATSNQYVKLNVQISDFGNYYCEISNGCETALTATSNVQVTSNTIIPVITETNGVLQSSVPYNIQWYYNGVAIVGATNEFYTPTQQGEYTVRSLAGDCSASSAGFTTGINDLNAVANISVYPNPSSGIFTVSVSDWTNEIQFELIDILGKTVYTNTSNQPTFDINLSALTSGIYVIKLESENYQSTHKLIKE